MRSRACSRRPALAAAELVAYLARAPWPTPEADSYYVADLIGLPVEDEGGQALGSVASIEPGVSNDVLELDSGLRLPLVEDCILSVDLPNGRIVIAPGFADPG